MVVWHLAVVGLSHHTKVGRNRAYGVARLGIGRRSVRSYTVLDKDKVWVHAAVGLPYPAQAVCALSARLPTDSIQSVTIGGVVSDR